MLSETTPAIRINEVLLYNSLVPPTHACILSCLISEFDMNSGTSSDLTCPAQVKGAARPPAGALCHAGSGTCTPRITRLRYARGHAIMRYVCLLTPWSVRSGCARATMSSRRSYPEQKAYKASVPETLFIQDEYFRDFEYHTLGSDQIYAHA